MSFLAVQPSRLLIRAAVLPRISHTVTVTAAAAANLAARSQMLSAVGYGIGLLGDIIRDAVLRAVPKQRTSHSKKRKRMAGKGLKNRQDLVPCSGCGRPKLLAHICLNCYHDIKRKLKGMKREAEMVKQEQ
ncbi:hypothetical protein LPJ64_004448 [Coemansia asiatica]|uniref:Large ribosomal subunit protein bL32m n=1 Tax=Coemansia asiatica TaxID=1052880 RepID=A0A9W8CJ15_9FUNG|nr:hypothetical protein LPJ64_004448 [Coemansia asiatica]